MNDTTQFNGDTIPMALRRADKPREFFDKLLANGKLERTIPEMAALAEMPAGPEEYHAEGSAFEHSMRVLEEMNALRPNDERTLLAAAFHDIGKSDTESDVLPHHYQHEKRGKHVAADIADRLEMPAEYRGVMMTAARMHGRMHDIKDLREKTLLDMVAHLRADPEESVVDHITLDELIDLTVADTRGREPQGEFDTEYADEVFTVAKDAVDEISASDVLAERDINPEHVDGVLLQERIRRLKEDRKAL